MTAFLPFDRSLFEHPAKIAQIFNKPAIGVLPLHFPIELIEAAGALPVEVFGIQAPVSTSDRLAPPFICSLVKTFLETAMTGGFEGFKGFAIANICDSCQNAAGTLHYATQGRFFTVLMNLSMHPEAQSAKEFLRHVVLNVKEALEQGLNTNITDGKLSHAIRETVRLRLALRKLLEKRALGPLNISTREVIDFVRSCWMMPRSQAADMVESVLPRIQPQSPSGPGVLLSGIVPAPYGLLDEIEKAGAFICGDDLGISWRNTSGPYDTEGDPIDLLINRLLNLEPCSTLHFQRKDRGDHLLERVKQTGAKAVVFFRLKFCDPEAFDHPYLKSRLDAENIPSQMVETDLRDASFQGAATRITALIESL